jgi:RNA polymerase sigma-70 factor (ECF subfamily)
MTIMEDTAPIQSQPGRKKIMRASPPNGRLQNLPGSGFRPAGSQQVGNDEQWLIQSARQGSLDAFNQLVTLYQDMVFHQAYRMLGEGQAADDATQEAFISAYRNLNTYRGGSFRAWLSRIVTNLSYDELRRRKARPTIPFEVQDSYGEEIESPDWATAPEETPEERLLQSEMEDTIQACLNRLPPEHRSILVMVDMLGLEYGEAAEALGRPIGTVKSRLARARTRMRAILKTAYSSW